MNSIKQLICICFIGVVAAQKILIPMDHMQSNHLKAYGIAFQHLENSNNVEWLLNYRGGSFLLNDSNDIQNTCKIRGVNYEMIDSWALSDIFSTIESNNMDIILLKSAQNSCLLTSGKAALG